MPQPVEVDQGLREKERRPGLEAYLHIDYRADDCGGQHKDQDAVSIFELPDVSRRLQDRRDLTGRRRAARIAACGELRRLHEDPIVRIVELIGGDALEILHRRQRHPANPVCIGAPCYPAGTELETRGPHPAHLRIVGPAAIMMDDAAPIAGIVEVPAKLLRANPLARRVRMPAERRRRRHPYFPIAYMLDEADVFRQNGTHARTYLLGPCGIEHLLLRNARLRFNARW